MMAMRHEKDQGGCVWSLMSKLHSRRGGSTQKLLLDRNRCNEAVGGHGTSKMGFDLMTVHDENLSKRSVKTLVEEEMITEAEVEWINSLKRGKRSCDCITDDDDNKSSCDRSDEQSSADDVREVVEYLGSLFQLRNGIWEEQDGLGEEFSQALGKALSQQLVNGRRLFEDEIFRRSKVFVSMVRILNSAEFSLLELTRDPEVMLMKCMEILQRSSSNSSAAKSILSGDEDGNRIKTNVRSPLVPSRVVILKPWMMELPKPAKLLNPGILRGTKSIGTKRPKKKSSTPSFLSGIKRKLKNIVSKEYTDESADSIGKMSRKERCGRGSSEKNPFGKYFKNEPARVSVRTYKHLTEAITDGGEDTSSSRRDPETMGTILLNPELNSYLRTSPGRIWACGAVNGSFSRIVRDKGRKPEFARVVETDTYAFKFLDENIRPSTANGDGADAKVFQGSMEESSDGSVIIKKVDEDPDIAVDLPERPSPVSVLEQHFSDDDTSPAIFERGMPVGNFRLNTEFLRRRLEIELEEDNDIHVPKADARERTFEEDEGLVLDRVATLLLASGLKWEDLYLKSQTLNRLLEPSLLCDRHLFKDDAKLLVDCINEVIAESCARFISRSSLWLTKRRIKSVPSMDFTIHEVCRGVKWHLDLIPHPRSLEQIVEKDFSRTESWMDLTLEGESIGFEVCDAILSKLMDEIMSNAERSQICSAFADPS